MNEPAGDSSDSPNPQEKPTSRLMWGILAAALAGSAIVGLVYNEISKSADEALSADQADGFNIAIDTQAPAARAPAAAPEAAVAASTSGAGSGLGMVAGGGTMQFGYATPPPGSAPGKLGPNKGGKVDEGAVMGKIMNSNPNLQNAEQNPGGAVK